MKSPGKKTFNIFCIFHIIFAISGRNNIHVLHLPELDIIEIDPSELPQAKTSPNSWGPNCTEFTGQKKEQNKYYT